MSISVNIPHPQPCGKWQKDRSCKFGDQCRYALTFVVGAGCDCSNTPRGRGPSVKKTRGGQSAEETKNQVHVVMNAMTVGGGRKGVLLNEEFGLAHAEINEEMRPYAYGERRRPAPRPKGWMTTHEKRSTICVRDRLRAARIGKELAFEFAPKVASGALRDAPSVTHASRSLLLGEVATEAGRWVIDRGSCTDIVGEGPITKNEKNIVEDMETPMRLTMANGEVTASNNVKVALEPATTAETLIVKGCPIILSLGKRCVEEGFSFVWRSGKRPILTTPDRQEYELEVENYVPVFHAMEASSSSMDPLVERGGPPQPSWGRSPTPSGGRPLRVQCRDGEHPSGPQPETLLVRFASAHRRRTPRIVAYQTSATGRLTTSWGRPQRSSAI